MDKSGEMKLFICGSRTITDRKWIFTEINKCINIADFKDISILEGGAKGVDTIAREYAIENNIPVVEYLPDYDKYHNKACHQRNEKMAKACDFMLVLWDGESGGTLHDILMAEKYNKPYVVALNNYDKVLTTSLRYVLRHNKEVFRFSENLKEVFPALRKAINNATIQRAYTDPYWEEGHNTGSCFWVMPVKQGKDSSEGSWGCFCCYEEEISIEEDVVMFYLYLQFLKPHFDKSIKYTCKNYPEPEFDWWGYNLYTYDTVRKMAEEMKRFATEVDLGKCVSEFYNTLADRLLLMMERQPNWDFITFEGP